MAFQLNFEQLRKLAKQRVQERRAAGEGVKLAEVQFELARELGFESWPRLKAYVERIELRRHRGDAAWKQPPTPFVLAYRAVEENDRERLIELLDRFPDLVSQRGTNGNDLLGMAGDLSISGRSCTRPAMATIASWRG